MCSPLHESCLNKKQSLPHLIFEPKSLSTSHGLHRLTLCRDVYTCESEDEKFKPWGYHSLSNISQWISLIVYEMHVLIRTAYCIWTLCVFVCVCDQTWSFSDNINFTRQQWHIMLPYKYVLYYIYISLEKWSSPDTKKEAALYESQPIYQRMNHWWERSQWKNSGGHLKIQWKKKVSEIFCR